MKFLLLLIVFFLSLSTICFAQQEYYCKNDFEGRRICRKRTFTDPNAKYLQELIETYPTDRPDDIICVKRNNKVICKRRGYY
jgi:hypothetical protein